MCPQSFLRAGQFSRNITFEFHGGPCLEPSRVHSSLRKAPKSLKLPSGRLVGTMGRLVGTLRSLRVVTKCLGRIFKLPARKLSHASPSGDDTTNY